MASDKTISDLEYLYRNEFLPAYFVYINCKKEKPNIILTEIYDTFSHLMMYYNPEFNDDKKTQNLSKSFGHLTRATIDLYKLFCVDLLTSVNAIKNNQIDEKVLSSKNFQIDDFNRFKENFSDAVNSEKKLIDKKPEEILEKYKKVAQYGYEFLRNNEAIISFQQSSENFSTLKILLIAFNNLLITPKKPELPFEQALKK